MNTLESSIITSPFDKDEECAKFTVDTIADSFVLTDLMSIDTDYVFTCWIKSEATGSVVIKGKTIPTSTTWEKQIILFTADSVDLKLEFGIVGTYYIYHSKLELGNVPSDWSPNPEDIESDVDRAQSTADDAKNTADSHEDRLHVAESTIKQLSDSISMLVTDENGSSMMTQTSEGWTFNIGAINSALNSATEKLGDLSGAVGEASSAIDNLESLTNDIAQKTAYIIMTTDETGAPCIELGKSDNDFKVRITNTSVDFMDGSSRIAYVSNQALYIERAIIKDELQIGEGSGFVWKKRANGNMGLRWVGG